MLLHKYNVSLDIDINKFALLWGEAQLCLPYVCLYVEKKLPIVTLR